MTRLQTHLFEQLNDKSMFDQAQRSANRYIEQIPSRPILPGPEQAALLSQFEQPLENEGVSAESIIQMLDTTGADTTLNHNNGRYFGFVNGSALPTTLAVKWITDVWDQNAALNVMSPISATLESVCQRWMVELLGLPDNTVMGMVGGTSVATLCGLAAARFRQLQTQGWDINQQGLIGSPPLKIVLSEQSHGTVVKMLNLLGFGRDNLTFVASDAQGRISVEDLPELDAQSILILQAGNVNTGAFDDFTRICDMARANGCWVHVDGAFGLWAAAAKQYQHLTKGVELADSWSVDGHKTLNTPYDCGMILCRDEQALVSALHQQGSYIQLSEARDGMLYTPDMSRRARGPELWAALKSLGKQGVDELISLLCLRAQQLADGLSQLNLTVLNDVVFNQVLFSCSNPEQTNALLAAIQHSGEMWCGGTQWQGRPAIRLSVCSWTTTEQDVSFVIRQIESLLEQLNKHNEP